LSTKCVQKPMGEFTYSRFSVVSLKYARKEVAPFGWTECSLPLSEALRWSAYAAVNRVGRFSKYTPSGVWPSSARCGLVRLENVKVAVPSLLGRADGLVGVQIDLLVCDALPESLHEHIVAPAACGVHADLNAGIRRARDHGEYPCCVRPRSGPLRNFNDE
jgi:hypothetical protein